MTDFPSSPVTATVTGSWSNDQELIALCMDMLGDVPGETLDQRVEKLVSYHLELQLMYSELRGHAQTGQEAREKEITRLATIVECALVAEGFDAACNSPRMKLFEEAGLVIAVYKRDGEIGAAIRALADTSTVGNSK